MPYTQISKLRQRRFEHGLTIKELAAQTGIGEATIVTTETGQRMPTIQTVHRLAAHYGAPVKDLVREIFEHLSEKPRANTAYKKRRVKANGN